MRTDAGYVIKEYDDIRTGFRLYAKRKVLRFRWFSRIKLIFLGAYRTEGEAKVAMLIDVKARRERRMELNVSRWTNYDSNGNAEAPEY